MSLKFITPARVGVMLAIPFLLAAPILAVTTDPAAPFDTGTAIDVHCQSEPTANVIVFYLGSDSSHRYGSELPCPTLGFRQVSPLEGYFVEIDKTQLAGDEDALSLADLRADPGYAGEAHVEWLTPPPPASPTP